jgi:hypothetical protein
MTLVHIVPALEKLRLHTFLEVQLKYAKVAIAA